MFFTLAGIKNTPSKQITVDLVLEHAGKNELLSFLKKNNILVLSVTEYATQPEQTPDFGETIFAYKDGDAIYRGYAKTDTKNAFTLLVKQLAFRLIYLNFRSTPIPKDESVKILRELQQKRSQEQEQTQEQTNEQKKEAVKNEKVDTIKETILANIQEARELVETTKNSVPAPLIKELSDTISQLLRLRMGRNIDKLMLLFEDLLRLMEKVETVYYSKEQSTTTTDTTDEYINYLDVVKEYEHMKKAKKSTSIKGSMNSDLSTTYYAKLGRIGVYLNLIIKESRMRLQQKNRILYVLFDSVELFCVFYITGLTLLITLPGTPLTDTFYTYIIFVGLFGILMSVAKFFRKAHTLYLLGLLSGVFVLFGVCTYFLQRILL